MIRVKPGSVRQNCRASSRAVAVQRLCPSSRGPSRRAARSVRRHPRGKSQRSAGGVGAWGHGTRFTPDTKSHNPGPTSLLTPTKPDHRVRLVISTMPGTTMHRAWGRRESTTTRRPPEETRPVERDQERLHPRAVTSGATARPEAPAASPRPMATPSALRPASGSCGARGDGPCASCSTPPWWRSTDGAITPPG